MTPPPALFGPPALREGLRPDTSRPRAVGAVLLGLAVVMLLATTGLGIVVVQQTGTLRSSVAFTQEAVDANVRTLGQAQRELLRLRTLLLGAPLDTSAIGLTQSFVDQRVQEGALPYQGKTLGSDELLARSATLAARWTTDVRPAVAAAVAAGDAARIAARPTGWPHWRRTTTNWSATGRSVGRCGRVRPTRKPASCSDRPTG